MYAKKRKEKESEMVKISVVVPIYNVEKYLRQCLDSITVQTLEDIEIICVNDGSSDSSLSIIKEYAERDPRFKVIDKQNSGYGHSVNMGFDVAQGEYIAIVESDDYIEPDMMESLYTVAKENDLDVCKGGYYFYYSAPNERHVPAVIGEKSWFGRVICPRAEFKSGLGFKTLREQISFFGVKATVWSAIYKNSFIKDSGIRFTQTPGASFQDVAFNFKVWALAKRVMLYDRCLLHYRQDNESSSINSKSKIYCVCDELAEIESFLSEKHLDGTELSFIKGALRYNHYVWNYERLGRDAAQEFLPTMVDGLKSDMEKGHLSASVLPRRKWKRLLRIVENPQGYHEARQREKEDEAPVCEADEQGGAVKRWLRRLKKHGIRYTVRSFFRKL